MAQRVKHLHAMQETWVRSPGREVPLEKEMATHFIVLLPTFLRVETISANHEVAVIYLFISYGCAAQHV